MGVTVSRQETRTKVKYIPADDYDEGETFLNESSEQLNAKEKTTRDGKRSSKRNESGYLQFLCGTGNSRSTFDSLETIDARKSVPFAVLPGINAQASSSGDSEDVHDTFYHKEGNFTLKTSGKVLFVDEPPDDLQQGVGLVDKLAGKNRDKDTSRHKDSRGKSWKANKVSSAQREAGDGREIDDEL